MLQLLEYSVEFPTTGRSFQNRIEFAPGLTAVTGRNEAGKTLVVEMIRYAFFGKDALRGLASDYRNLAVHLVTTIQGKVWDLDRAKKETFTIDGEVIAVGAQAINAAVPKHLGYGMDVFDIAQAALQGDLGQLTEMKPTPRRQMVEQLIGLDLLEAVEKDCKAEAKTQETVALSLLTSMAMPVEPTTPADYQPSQTLTEELAVVQAHEAERQQLLRLVEPVAPVEPTNPNLPPVEELEQHEEQRQNLLREQASLEGQLRGMPEARYSREDLERAVAYQTYEIEVGRRGVKPVYTEEQLQHFEAIWAARDAVAAGGDPTTCPKCDHHFRPGVADEIVKLAEQEIPRDIARGEIRIERQRILAWAEPLAEVPEFYIDKLQTEITAHAYADDRTALLDRLGRLSVPADRSGDLRAARAYDQALAIYSERVDRYGAELATFRDAQSRLAGMADRSGETAALQRRLGDARAFEAAADRHQHDLARYTELSERAAAAREAADGFQRGSLALRNARTRVKQELAPSLSSAASKLLYAMTDGERRHVDVDHDFNITVDGQPLQTLSGSGKSVVNLALRIGLGQVLTSKVLPIFMGDEIDADLDSNRTNAVAGTLNSLREYLTQIIIVTHKQNVEADQVISL